LGFTYCIFLCTIRKHKKLLSGKAMKLKNIMLASCLPALFFTASYAQQCPAPSSITVLPSGQFYAPNNWVLQMGSGKKVKGAPMSFDTALLYPVTPKTGGYGDMVCYYNQLKGGNYVEGFSFQKAFVGLTKDSIIPHANTTWAKAPAGDFQCLPNPPDQSNSSEFCQWK
jgi:hypothetical protein